MGGTSQSTTQQQSTTQPWAQAQPLLGGILSQLEGQLPNTSMTGAQGSAINTIENNAALANQFAPQINGVTSSLLAGGGALSQAPAIQNAFNNYQAQTNPLASNTNYNPYNTPGFSDALNTATSDITNNINGQFAAAGRDMSGANTQALSRGLAQGLAPIIQSQYQNNVANQQGAAGNLYNAGNTTSGLLSGLNQQGLSNQLAGVGNVSSGLDASNAGSNATLQAEAQRLGIPLGNLGLISQLGVPIAGLGSQSTGSGTTQNQMSGVQQFMGIASGLNSLVNPLKMFGF